MNIRLHVCASATALALVATSCAFDAGGIGGPGDDGGAPDANDRGDDPDGGEPGDLDGGPQPDADEGDASLCTPNEQFCDGRTIRTCNEDGTGAVDGGDDEVCAFTCADAQCVFASNLPEAAYAACDESAPPLTPPQGATVAFERENSSVRITCSPHCGDGSTEQIPVTSKESQGGGNAPIAVFCLERLTLDGSHTVTVSEDAPLGDAIALIADGPAVIGGAIDVRGAAGAAAAPGRRGPGGWAGGPPSSSNGNAGDGDCGGGGGEREDEGAGGGAGGGHVTEGGAGGDGKDSDGEAVAGGDSLTGCGSEALSPLTGGYGGGSGASGSCGSISACGWAGGGGGGAIQISSRVSILVADGGVITASGGAGYGEANGPGSSGGGGGGGSGGAILLEAPEINLQQPGSLRVEGGAGGESAAGAGGAGATGDISNGEDGADLSGDGPGSGSGGGGGAGRVRMNSEEGEAFCTRVVPRGSGICSTGSLLRSAP